MNMLNKHTFQQTCKQIVWIYLMSSLYEEVMCKKELRLLGLLSETGVSYKSAGSCLTAIDMALEDIRRRGDILKGYNLTFNWVDSKCHAGTALFRMFERLTDDRPYQMLLGPPCSIAAEATAQVSYMWNLTQLSCEATSPILSDRTRFPRFFRTVMPDQKLNIARVAMLKEFNWQKVATVHQAREFFFSASHDARIIVTAMYEDKARELLCAAYKVGLYGSKIVWMFFGWYSFSFWHNHLDNIGCTKEQMDLAVEGAFLTVGLYKNPTKERGIANITVNEFEYRYYNRAKYSPALTNSDDITPALCYDYIWTAAIAFECTAQVLKENGHHKTLDQFTYADGDIGKIIFDCMGNTSMVGVSGMTSFDEGPDSEKAARIDRVQDGKQVVVGLYRQNKDPSFFEWIKGAIRWKDGKLPSDSAHVKNEEIQIPLTLYVVMATMSALGICLSLVFLGINIIHRNNRYVKLSSPNINNMLLLGCVLCYVTVFFKTTGPENEAICRARVYCFSLGFTLTFGSLFSKTWRVYRIFINKKLTRVQIKDSQLFVVNCVLVAMILVLLIIWDIVGPSMVKSKFLPKEVFKTTDGNEVRPFVRVCWSEYSTYFNLALYIIQGALLTFGTFLAWETRHVRVKGLNDSQKIGISIYNVVILCGVGVAFTLLLEDQEVLLYAISSACLILGTTVTQMLIFIPKVLAIVNKLEIDSVSTFANNTELSTRGVTAAESFKIRAKSQQNEGNSA